MNTWKDCSEFLEVLALFDDVLRDVAVPALDPPAVDLDVEAVSSRSEVATLRRWESRPDETPANATPTPPARGRVSRAESLEDALIQMCRRSGMSGAVLADSAGLPLAAYNSPVSAESVAALTAALGQTLELVGRLVGRHEADHVAVDVGLDERIVTRRLDNPAGRFYLTALCTHGVDERSEMELTITELRPIIAEP